MITLKRIAKHVPNLLSGFSSYAIELSVPGDLDCLFAGDTLHVGGGFDSEPVGEVTLAVTYEDESREVISTEIQVIPGEGATAKVLPRVLVHQWLAQLDDSKRIDAAIDYHLLTKGTRCLMTHQRADENRAEELPALRKVPNQLPGGFSGVGSVSQNGHFDNLDSSIKACVPSRSRSEPPMATSDHPFDDFPFDVPTLLRRVPHESSKDEFDDSFAPMRPSRESTADLTISGDARLDALGVPSALCQRLISRSVHKVKDLLAVPKAEWENQFGLKDEDIAVLLRALRAAGIKVQ